MKELNSRTLSWQFEFGVKNLGDTIKKISIFKFCNLLQGTILERPFKIKFILNDKWSNFFAKLFTKRAYTFVHKTYFLAKQVFSKRTNDNLALSLQWFYGCLMKMNCSQRIFFKHWWPIIKKSTKKTQSTPTLLMDSKMGRFDEN